MNAMISFLPIVLMFGIFYLIVFVPENKRKKKYAAMLSSVKVNDEIVTRGGIVGKVINIDDDYVVIQSGPDKARIKLTKEAIERLITEKAEPSKESLKSSEESTEK